VISVGVNQTDVQIQVLFQVVTDVQSPTDGAQRIIDDLNAIAIDFPEQTDLDNTDTELQAAAVFTGNSNSNNPSSKRKSNHFEYP